jgi:hypothetical protein
MQPVEFIQVISLLCQGDTDRMTGGVAPLAHLARLETDAGQRSLALTGRMRRFRRLWLSRVRDHTETA